MRGMLLACVLVVGACPRLATPGAGDDGQNVPPAALGESCAADAECRSGHCVDGVCCQSACEAQEACNLPRAPGTCTPRRLGDACTASPQCPTEGGCVDGVCCQSGCGETCYSCAVPGQEGTCMLAQDNTDVRGDCDGACSACFGGLCLPALAETDPKGECAAQQKVCGGTGACTWPRGHACSVDGDCGTGRCALDGCVAVTHLRIAHPVLDPRATRLITEGLAVAPDGTATVLLRETIDAGRAEVRRFVAVRPDSVPALATEVIAHYDCPYESVFDGFYPPASTITAVGTGTLVLVGDFEDVCARLPGQENALWAYWFDAQLRLIQSEKVPLATTDLVDWVTAVFDPDAQKVTAVVHHLGPSRAPLTTVSYALATGRWEGARQLVSTAGIRGAMAISDHAPLAVFSETPSDTYADEITVLRLAATDERDQIATTCDARFMVAAATGSTTLIQWLCGLEDRRQYWATYDPSRPAGERFGPVQSATSSHYAVLPFPLRDGRIGAITVDQEYDPRIDALGLGRLMIAEAINGQPLTLQPLSSAWGREQAPNTLDVAAFNGGAAVSYNLESSGTNEPVGLDPPAPQSWFLRVTY